MKSMNGLMSDIKKSIASSRNEQQRLIIAAQNQIRIHGANPSTAAGYR